jgi:choline dehydrogenase
MLVALLQPSSRGRIQLSSAVPDAPLLIRPALLEDPADLERVVYGAELVRDLARTVPLAARLGDEQWTGGADVARTVKAEIAAYHHPVGTCRMGPASDPESVVDHTGHVYGLDNLIVADASIVPVIPAANTNLTALMLAEKLAEQF